MDKIICTWILKAARHAIAAPVRARAAAERVHRTAARRLPLSFPPPGPRRGIAANRASRSN